MESKHEKSSSSAYYTTNYQYISAQRNEDGEKMHGIRRVVIFCLLTAVLPTLLIVLPLYLRHIRYADVMYKVSDSDVIQIHKGQSSIFCEKHSLKMNTTFHAFQMKGQPTLSNKRKHVKLKKSMILPDDTLEYWGFYLLTGATVELKACSRFEGSKILVVKGERILNTCGILENHKDKVDPSLTGNPGVVVATIERPAGKNNTKVNDFVLQDENNAEEQDSIDYEAENEMLHMKKILQNLNSVETITSSNGKSKENHQVDVSGMNAKHSNLKLRKRRDIKRQPLHNPNTVLDTGVNHGGNAFNNTIRKEDVSISSFENTLHLCYSGNILINDNFPYALQCKSVEYLEETTTLKITHNVLVDGYYYYIFYSDNDFVENDIHAVFDIYKPTFQYTNLSDSKTCVNKTECEFHINFLSNELVIVEIPTKDGIEHDDDDSTILISTCHPRMSVYILFPVLVLLLVLGFAFL